MNGSSAGFHDGRSCGCVDLIDAPRQSERVAAVTRKPEGNAEGTTKLWLQAREPEKNRANLTLLVWLDSAGPSVLEPTQSGNSAVDAVDGSSTGARAPRK